MKSQIKPLVSIIIVNWNTKELLKQCLKSIIGNQLTVNSKQKRSKEKPTDSRSPITDGSLEIIVVDNGSTDGSIEEIKKIKLKNENAKIQFNIIINKKNLGFAKANNQGIKITRGEYILILNSDTEIKAGTLGTLFEFIRNNPNSAVSPQLVLPNGNKQDEYYMKFPNLWQVLLYHHPLIRPFILKKPIFARLMIQSPKNVPFKVDQLPGAALMASRSIWEKVGRFDEDYHFLFEDVDWCWRAKNMGVILRVVPKAVVVHIGGASWKNKIKINRDNFYHQYFSSMLLFVRKNYSENKYRIFKTVIILNFLVTAKWKLAVDLYKNPRQKSFK